MPVAWKELNTLMLAYQDRCWEFDMVKLVEHWLHDEQYGLPHLLRDQARKGLHVLAVKFREVPEWSHCFREASPHKFDIKLCCERLADLVRELYPHPHYQVRALNDGIAISWSRSEEFKERDDRYSPEVLGENSDDEKEQSEGPD